MPIPIGLAARASLELTDGRKVYIEVKDGSPFVHFYTVRIVLQQNHRRTVIKCPGRSRNYAVGIEEAAGKMALHFNTYGNAKVRQTTIRIYRKRLYEKRYRLGPGELGLSRIYNTLDRYRFKMELQARLFERKTVPALGEHIDIH
jgi:hypothetical protein